MADWGVNHQVTYLLCSFENGLYPEHSHTILYRLIKSAFFLTVYVFGFTEPLIFFFLSPIV